MILAARSGLDAACDVDAPRVQGVDCFRHIFRTKAAGENQMQARLRGEDGGGSGPVERDAGAAGYLAYFGVDEDAAGGWVRGDGGELLRDLVSGFPVVTSFVAVAYAPVSGFEDADGGGEQGGEGVGDGGLEAVMKLDAGEAGGFNGGGDLGSENAGENADTLDGRGELVRDGADLLGGDLALTGGEHEA